MHRQCLKFRNLETLHNWDSPINSLVNAPVRTVASWRIKEYISIVVLASASLLHWLKMEISPDFHSITLTLTLRSWWKLKNVKLPEFLSFTHCPWLTRDTELILLLTQLCTMFCATVTCYAGIITSKWLFLNVYIILIMLKQPEPLLNCFIHSLSHRSVYTVNAAYNCTDTRQMPSVRLNSWPSDYVTDALPTVTPCSENWEDSWEELPWKVLIIIQEKFEIGSIFSVSRASLAQ